jgi:hypothetical protein
VRKETSFLGKMTRKVNGCIWCCYPRSQPQESDHEFHRSSSERRPSEGQSKLHFVITFALKAIRFQGIPCARNKRTLKQMFSTEMSRLEKNQRKKCSWIKTFLSRQIYHREPPGLSYWDPLWGAMAAASLLKGSRFKPSIHVLRSRTPAFLSGAIPL